LTDGGKMASARSGVKEKTFRKRRKGKGSACETRGQEEKVVQYKVNWGRKLGHSGFPE